MPFWRQRFAGLLQCFGLVAASCVLAGLLAVPAHAARPDEVPTGDTVPLKPAEPRPAAKPVKVTPTVPARPAPPAAVTAPNPAAQAERLRLINAAKSWGYQLNGMKVDEAARSPFDLIVADATTGHFQRRHFLAAEVAALKKKPNGVRRIVVSYLSIGEAEDYRAEYFSGEYLSEDAPEWLLHENPQWKGNRVIKFCDEGWQRTILGDDDGRSLYNAIEPSPLHRLIELGFDGVYLDRVDVYNEVQKACPDSAKKMVDFVARLAAHARKRNPNFLVILQNAEELVRQPKMMDTIDAIAKEDLFYGADHTQNANKADSVRETLGHLKAVKAAGRPVFVVDYVTADAKKADAKRRMETEGFIPYIAPRDLGSLWLPGKDF